MSLDATPKRDNLVPEPSIPENLLEIIAQIPQKIVHPIPHNTLNLLHGLGSEIFNSQIEQSSITFRAQDITSLNEFEFNKFLRLFYEKIIETDPETIAPQGLIDNFMELIDPNNLNTNVLRHERGHAEPLENDDLNSAEICIIFYQGHMGDLGIDGFTSFPKSVTPRVRAICMCNPKSLSLDDVSMAREKAGETTDSIFIDQINEIIQSKRIHEFHI